MSDLHKLVTIAALSVGLSFGDQSIGRREPTGPSLPPAPPQPLTKRQKRRLRGKARNR